MYVDRPKDSRNEYRAQATPVAYEKVKAVVNAFGLLLGDREIQRLFLRRNTFNRSVSDYPMANCRFISSPQYGQYASFHMVLLGQNYVKRLLPCVRDATVHGRRLFKFRDC